MSGADGAKEMLVQVMNKGLDRAVGIARPAILSHIAQSRRTRPEATPSDIIDVLGRRFTAAVASSGTLTGATAAAPGISTPASFALALGDATGFTGLAAMYVFALAEIHDVPIDELERRRTLLLGVLLGDLGTDTVRRAAGRTGPHWARSIVKAIPVARLHQVNKVLGKNFVTKYGTKQGVLVLGKQLPLGLGAAIGGVGNAAFARITIRSAKRAFGPPPQDWPAHLDQRSPSEAPPAAAIAAVL